MISSKRLPDLPAREVASSQIILWFFTACNNVILYTKPWKCIESFLFDGGDMVEYKSRFQKACVIWFELIIEVSSFILKRTQVCIHHNQSVLIPALYFHHSLQTWDGRCTDVLKKLTRIGAKYRNLGTCVNSFFYLNKIQDGPPRSGNVSTKKD